MNKAGGAFRKEGPFIKESDIKETFVRSSGPGGQNVNKTSTTVYLKHIPTGIEVKCQAERSQVLNRRIARKVLAEKVAALIFKQSQEARQRAEKLRRQSRPRPKKLKLKILDSKRRQAEKKKLRARVHQIE